MEEYIEALLLDRQGAPVFWGVADSSATLPWVVLTQVSGVRAYTLRGKGLITGRLQVDCYGATAADSMRLKREILEILEGHAGGPVQGVFLDVVRGGIAGDADLSHRNSLTFTLQYTENLPG